MSQILPYKSAQTQDGDAMEQETAPVSAKTKTTTSSKKAPGAFLTISEVSDELDVPHHVLRFWETKFPQVKPLKRGGGRRYYRPEDVAVLKRIHHLLYSDKYTIKGAQKLLKGKSKLQIIQDEVSNENGVNTAPASNDAYQGQTVKVAQPAKDNNDDQYRAVLKDLLGDLKELRSMVAPKDQANGEQK
jgi:DNA-binding transcriptional MerR regulator